MASPQHLMMRESEKDNHNVEKPWNSVSNEFGSEVPNKRARHMIKLVDSFVGSQELKNKAKNMLGRIDLAQGIRESVEQDEFLGILSPLARPTSTSSGMIEKDSALSFKYREETKWGNVFTPLTRHGFFRCLLELNKDRSVSKEAWSSDDEEAENQKQVYFRDILRSRGCECCCMNDCPYPSGLSVIRVNLGLKGYERGVSLMCQAHVNAIRDTPTFILPKDAHVFIC